LIVVHRSARTMGAAESFETWRPAVSVFIPYFVKDGRLESPEYDLPGFREELNTWFTTLGYEWRWVAVTLGNLPSVIADLEDARRAGGCLVLNLCDGNELDGSPGVSVVRALEIAGIPFTGSSAFFYEITTYKVPMKTRLRERGVATAPFVPLRNLSEDVARLEAEVGYPAFVKPEVSAGSGGIGLTSLVYDAGGVMARVSALLAGEDGNFYRESGIFAERFVDGPEFTVFVIADRNTPGGARAYPPVQRLFHSALPSHERFLSYDRYWSEYKEESRLPEGEPFYRYGLAPARLRDRLADLAVRAFLALDGVGYGRVDIRLEERTDQLFVLEANANCGLSGDRETSVGEMLFLAKVPVHHLVSEILRDAYDRFSSNGHQRAR
jgi:D-alanine-D-alanine ligase